MESTTKKLTATAMGYISVFKQQQHSSAAFFTYCSSLPCNYENTFLVRFIFWCPGLSLSRKLHLPDFFSNYFQKFIHEKTTAI